MDQVKQSKASHNTEEESKKIEDAAKDISVPADHLEPKGEVEEAYGVQNDQELP